MHLDQDSVQSLQHKAHQHVCDDEPKMIKAALGLFSVKCLVSSV